MNLPVDFISQMQLLLGEQYPVFASSLEEVSPVSIRMNRMKTSACPDGEPVHWSPDAFYLPQRLSFTFDPLFHAGTYYVQEASSMFLEQAVRAYVEGPVKCLDLCAAPGGKSTHLISLLPEGSLLVSNEVIRSRSHVLAENITKWGAPQGMVTNNDPAEIGRLTHYFDVIVTDVPCSGEGMFRKDPQSREEWSLAHVELCASRQRRIIHDVWNALAPGGILIYSTCTYNTRENEENIHYIAENLGADVLGVPVDPAWEIEGPLLHSHPVYRFFPHRTKGEGFFMAVLRKHGGERESVKRKSGKPKNRSGRTPVISPDVSGWLRNGKKYVYRSDGFRIKAFPDSLHEDMEWLGAQLKVVTGGVSLAEIKGKDLIPDPALAFNCAFIPDLWDPAEVDYETAIRFLRKESVVLDSTLSKGFKILLYQGYPLGFVKHLGNRTNNLYPAEWRIRSSYFPEDLRVLDLK